METRMENYNKRLAGIFYLGMILFGMFAQITRSNVLAFDNINILEKIKSSILILRFAFLSDLLMILFYFLTAWVLYNILKNVNKSQSLLFFIFTIISVSIMSINMINHIAIIEINTSEYFQINKNYDLRSLSQLFSKFHFYGYLIAQVFFGLWLLPLGSIVTKYKIMPKYFGIMLIVATFGHLLEIIVTFVFPEYSFIIFPGLIISMIGEFSFCFWLLLKGLKIVNK
jgi:hypothetical protein